LDDIKTHKEIHRSYLNTIKSLVTAVEARDTYTRGHSEKVTKFALDIANALGLSKEDKLMLIYCGRLHDIGKIGISDAILNKPGPLTMSERAEVQLHPVRAVEMLSHLKFLERGIPAIRHHHERYDGKGYPDGLKGKDIPLLARILGCADAFDAMTSDRAYRKKMDLDIVLRELKTNRGKQFDPDVLDAFMSTLNIEDIDKYH
jgi:putative nucleotidyltransferase with HDIG domain